MSVNTYSILFKLNAPDDNRLRFENYNKTPKKSMKTQLLKINNFLSHFPSLFFEFLFPNSF